MNGHYHLKEIVEEIFTVRKSCSGQRGTMLVGLIITLIIISVLGAAMLSFFSTSTMSQLSGNSSMQAYYLAESGFRYADGELARTSMSVRDNKIESMHDTDYVLTDNDGTFHLDMYPYFFKVDNDPVGTTVLDANVPGGFPLGLTLTSGYVYIDDTPYQYSNAAQSGNTVTFTRASGNWPSIDSGTTIRSASMPDGNQTVTGANNYIDLESSTGSANAFPKLNGTFRVSGKSGVWVYKVRSGNRLEGVSPVDDPEWSKTTALGISATDYIILEKYVEVQSTGIIHETEELETKRVLTYHTSLSESYKTTFHETFEDKSKWTEKKGAFAIGSVGGDNVLEVTGTVSQPGAPKVSLVAFDWASTALNLNTVHYNAGNYLSYDSQVKVGFEATHFPTYGYEPPSGPVPKYFAAGISFRLDSDENYYGLSFLRGSNDTPPLPDNLNNNIVPVDNKLSIVLWQKTGPNESDWTWLAYKELPPSFSVNGATLMVRIIEAASLQFTVNATEIDDGDIISQSSTKASGTVVGKPILSSVGNGIILLNNLYRDSGGSIIEFDDGEVSVRGQTVDVSNFEERCNYIRAYYADPASGEMRNIYPLDEIRYKYRRGDDIQWPPDDLDDDCHWTEDKDYFTLVRWDHVKDSVSSLCEPNVIVRSSESKLLTLDTDVFSDSELGLHALGQGAMNVYFDDFAIQAEIRAKRTGFLSTIQQ